MVRPPVGGVSSDTPNQATLAGPVPAVSSLVRGPGGRAVLPMAPPAVPARLGTGPAHKGAGLRGVPAEGAYSRVVAWDSRASWWRGVVLWVRSLGVVRSPVTGDAMHADTLLPILADVLDLADTRTGRGIDPHRAAVAARHGCSPKTVQRALRLASRVLGILVPVGAGRPLTLAERLPLAARGLAQRGIAALWAAHTPRALRAWIALARRRTLVTDAATGRLVAVPAGETAPSVSTVVGHVPHPVGPSRQSSHLTFSTTHLGRGSAARPRKTEDVGKIRGVPATTAKMRALGAALAADLASALPWGGSIRPRAVAAHTARFAVAGWSARDFLRAVEQVYRDTGWVMPTVVRSAGGMVHHWTTLLDPDTDRPAVDGVPVRAVPCGAPGCDTGWVEVPHPVTGQPAAAPCPSCPPIVRTGAWAAETDRLADEGRGVDGRPEDTTTTTADVDGGGRVDLDTGEILDDAAEGAAGAGDAPAAVVEPARVEAVLVAALAGTPLIDHPDTAAAAVLLADPVAARLDLWRLHGLTPVQVEAIDPAAARRWAATGRLDRADDARRRRTIRARQDAARAARPGGR